MKTTILVNKTELQAVTKEELIAKTENQNIKNYLNVQNWYSVFCKNQTKTGQARKNERARARHKHNEMLADLKLSEQDKQELDSLRDALNKEKNKDFSQAEVEITFDGRKKGNLGRIVQGVKMYYHLGSISPQYYDLGLREVNVLNQA